MPSQVISKSLLALSLMDIPSHIKTKLFLLFKQELDILFKSKTEITSFLKIDENIEINEDDILAEILTEKVFEKIANFKDWDKVEKILKFSASNSCTLISPLDDEYPKSLLEIIDFPVLLYCKGAINLLNSNCFSVVGSRKASMYASTIINEFVPKLVKAGKTIVSGMAIGVDSMAHKSCLACNGKTIAVLGSGVNVIYPNTNKNLYENILKNDGLIISEFEFGYPALPQNFPKRNRIVAGLSKDVIIIEAKLKSGSLITARLSMEYNRNVFSVPASIFDKSFEGSNELIKQGAYILTKFEDLNIPIPEETNKDSNLNENEKLLLKFIDKKGINFNTLLNVSKYSIVDLSSLLDVMEEKNIVYRDVFDNIFKS